MRIPGGTAESVYVSKDMLVRHYVTQGCARGKYTVVQEQGTPTRDNIGERWRIRVVSDRAIGEWHNEEVIGDMQELENFELGAGWCWVRWDGSWRERMSLILWFDGPRKTK